VGPDELLLVESGISRADIFRAAALQQPRRQDFRPCAAIAGGRVESARTRGARGTV
jgi:hypothetical protein